MNIRETMKFSDFLAERLETGGFSTEDTLASFLPLLRQVVTTHDSGQVAPLVGLDALRVQGVALWFEEARRMEPRQSLQAVRNLQEPPSSAVEVVDSFQRATDIERGTQQVTNLAIGNRGQPITRPVYLPGYVSWEHEIEHHDALTDTFNLGLILASLGCGLDFTDPEQLETFVANRKNLFSIRGELHPVLAKGIFRMTALNRHDRPQDLTAVLHTLENYKDQDVDFDYDLARVEGFREQDLHGKRQIVLSRLQERLFEISRRNRLLHFRQTLQSVNLTYGSVPLSFDVRSIRADQLLTWTGEFREAVVAGKRIHLNKYLQLDEALYLPGVLDRIRLEARRDQNEFGFAQLRLVICFLNWTNLKETPPERYDSPLLLLPVQLIKKKGVRDTYWVEPLDSVVQVNPVLRHYFKQLYGIEMPETIELTPDCADKLYDFLESRIKASQRAVTLEKVDKPRIDKIHEQARRRLDQYQRRVRLAGRGVHSFGDLDYSYNAENYHPLGLRIFQTKVRPSTTLMERIVEKAHTHRRSPRTLSWIVSNSEVETKKERQFYSLRDSSRENPYAWEFDLCRVTLGNFKYRKMSLVRDYTELLTDESPNPAFDATFSLVPRAVDTDPPPSTERPPLAERYPVVPCDPTQAAAIAQARTGESYIIQGPPGTGKSQTISNLIADYVARGKHVLFVCEKRAAIDVVYHRLRQRNLSELCCLIHDSQADKKLFVMDLKRTYEGFLADTDGNEEPEKNRRNLLKAVDRELKPLRQFHDEMRATPDQAGIPLRKLLDRVVTLRQRIPDLTALDKERLPHYAVWSRNLQRIDRFVEAVAEIRPDRIIANHPLQALSQALVHEERPLERILSGMEEAKEPLDRLGPALPGFDISSGEQRTLAETKSLVEYAIQVRYLAERGMLSLLDCGSETSRRFAEATRKLKGKVEALEEARTSTTGWKRKLPLNEVSAALALAREFERSFLAFLRPAWWRLRRILRQSYDFSAHAVKPTWTRVLTALEAEYQAKTTMREVEKQVREDFAIEEEVRDFLGRVNRSREISSNLPAAVRPIHQNLLESESAPSRVAALADLQPHVIRLERALNTFLAEYDDLTLPQLRDRMAVIKEALDELPDFLHCLAELSECPPPLADPLYHMTLDPEQLEAALASSSLEDIFRGDRTLGRFSGRTRDRHVGKLDKVCHELEEANATVVRERVRSRFLEHVQSASQPDSQLSPEQKAFKKEYNQGRRQLEHEFGKTMRYKSIRDLVSGESGRVVRDLKPVWLMSPLSVSDTLPLDAKTFDVVIFDEASQITLEEAVPSLFRATQTIVVGDEMQLPPTNFFSAKRPEDEETLLIEEGNEAVEYELGSNSFLNHAALNLPATLLGWHYRSRSESLISFSNAAFYQGQLLTVPEERVTTPAVPDSHSDSHPLAGGGEVGPEGIRASSAEDGAGNVAHLLDRPVSFHLLEGAVYSKRRNRTEAGYIAHMVREFLKRKTGLSMGIVAFSEAQQDEIESALERLARNDKVFGDLLEAEYEREQDEQFVGLLVKNLENIQGDERDVIILSVCYGHGPDGKMRMHFGPINQSGGEKRLNVAFSRSKHHMAVVSSTVSTDITNEYNDGANCLRNYLRYASAMSAGNTEAARRVLSELALPRDGSRSADPVEKDAVVEQVASALRERGYIVDPAVGQSHFRCDLAIRRAGEGSYRGCVLVDHDAYYDHGDIIERDLMRPKLLRAFGWNVAHVLAKDWYADHEAVLEKLEAGLAG